MSAAVSYSAEADAAQQLRPPAAATATTTSLATAAGHHQQRKQSLLLSASSSFRASPAAANNNNNNSGSSSNYCSVFVCWPLQRTQPLPSRPAPAPPPPPPARPVHPRVKQLRFSDSLPTAVKTNSPRPQPDGRPSMVRLTMPTHNIPHVWSMKRCKNPNKRKCGICAGTMSFLSMYEKCRSCKISVHSDCKPRVQDNCGLTSKHFKELLTHMDNWAPSIGSSKSMNDMPLIQYNEPQTPNVGDSSSSTNSSAPSTPAFVNQIGPVPTISVHPPPTSSCVIDRLTAPPRTADLPSRSKQFTFPDVTGSSGESDSAQSSQSNGSMPFNMNHKWDRRAWNMFTIRHGSMSWKDVTIPIADIRINQRIGKGRFGDVFDVEHFGTVAIKFPRMDHIDDEKRVEAFKQETACFQNARHENLVFFVGYTMDQDKLGIVMERIRGPSLHKVIHDDMIGHRMDFNDVIDYAKQICQGMSYLHTKNITHKDLRSKNIFIDNRKAVITDFGLFNMKRLGHPKRKNGFCIPDHWVHYQAPEVLRGLTENLDTVYFTEKSDVYAFGTVWYELLAREFPFPTLSPEAVLWQVGVGMKTGLGKINVCREAKVLLMQCWSFKHSDRRPFVDLLGSLECMPRKALRRSPSFPVCKSFESIF